MTTASSPAFEIETIKDVAVLRFTKQRYYDSDKIEELSASLLKFADGYDGQKVLLNLSGINYFSSAAIGALIRVSKRLGQKQVKMRLSNLQPMVAEVMFLQRLHLVFDIDPDEATSLSKFK